jgi:hypothetical protein
MKRMASLEKTRANRRFPRRGKSKTVLELWNRRIFMTLIATSSAVSETLVRVEKPVDEPSLKLNPRFQQASIRLQIL